MAKDPNKASTLLRRAARILDASHRDPDPWKLRVNGACWAVRQAYLTTPARYETHERAREIFGRFEPTPGYTDSGYWWGLPRRTPNTNTRVIALLLAAEIAQSEGD